MRPLFAILGLLLCLIATRAEAFAGFIASAQESLTLVARKTIPLLMVALSLILTASLSHAGLGWTLAQFKQQYGEPVLNQEQIVGRIGYVFTGEDCGFD